MTYYPDDAEIWIYYRATHAESIEQRHAEIMANMSRIGPPLGLAGMELPPAPDCGVETVACYDIQYPIPGLWLDADYKYRGERYHYDDKRADDDKVRICFKTSSKAIDYRYMIYDNLPRVIAAFRGYRGDVTIGFHGFYYCGGLKETNPVYNRLRADKTLDVNGRNNIYTLEVVQYWDAELCRRALGYGPEEVIRRLKGRALMVEPLMDGVYLVLNDDPNLSYETFVAMNQHYKSILGLI
jgi:hypothetical protein